MRERERHNALLFQARHLAETGRYQTWREVEAALVSSGRDGVPQALSEPNVRKMLDKQCANAVRRRHEL